ncbi:MULTISPECIES: DGQHR domain-containing protein [unclassified Flavobacterium]|uniref:DGQHR domain-containing protein n=1 Tax=unclassified Flavobacterium TaxID=196869 RepID=UPI001F13A97C|nr:MULTISPECIES: DGQHR domain-containing protein [unclassified Flavobacterium]UMY64511.1 DGQHR domain-containing protein [Flavobacterium sp. HJ-32-4]
MISLKYIEIEQPIGSFYFTKMKATTLGELVNITPRSADPSAIQRDESKDRITEIAKYCSDPDATFPTPIIVGIYDNVSYQIKDTVIEFESNQTIGEVIDGQHRLKGLLKSNFAERFELPVVLLFDLTEEEKAYIFSIINSKQTKVSMSLIYDLFALSRYRSPQKTAHEIARSLNKYPESPFFNRLKMLGNKEESQEKATLSQGTFVKHFIELLSKDPDDDFRKSKNNVPLTQIQSLPLRQYFLDGQDEIILKITLNLFSALKDVFMDLWENPSKNILWKSTGYVAIIKSFDELYRIGDSNNDLSKNFFKDCFAKFRNKLEEQGLTLTSQHFPSNAQQQARLSKILIDSIKS